MSLILLSAVVVGGFESLIIIKILIDIWFEYYLVILKEIKNFFKEIKIFSINQKYLQKTFTSSDNLNNRSRMQARSYTRNLNKQFKESFVPLPDSEVHSESELSELDVTFFE